LRNVIERAVILESMSYLQSESLPGEIVSLSENRMSRSLHSEDIPVSVERNHLPFELNIPSEGVSLYEIEKQIILQALETTGYNQTKTSVLLGISRDTLRYKMKKYDL